MIRRAAYLLCAVLSAAAILSAIGADAPAAPVAVGRVHASFQPYDGRIFVLVIGNDARSGNPNASRADAIHIVGINTDTMKGGILNFPRDSWVSIPGRGMGKINEALHYGGPDGLAGTLENLTGIRLDYWVMVGFEGFRGILHELGGVRMKIPGPVYDPSGSGAHIDPGKQRLSAPETLAYARTRHSFSRGDIDRTTNQAKIILALLRKFRHQVEWNPSMLLKWMAATRKHARFDIGASEMFRLGVLASQVSARDVGSVTLPVSVGSVGAASVVFISPSARPIYARFRERGSL